MPDMPDASAKPQEAPLSCPAPQEPLEQHRWLRRLVGAWSFEGEMPAPPGEKGQAFAGTEMVRSLGGLWVVGEGENAMPEGGSMATMVTLGFDPGSDTFVGTFVCSGFTHLWLYRGRLEDGGRRLVLATEGPDMETGSGTAPFEDVMAFEDNDHRTLTSRMLGRDGQWHPLVTMRYRRLPA